MNRSYLRKLIRSFQNSDKVSFQVEVPKGKKELYRVMIEDAGWHIASYKYDYELCGIDNIIS